MAKKKRKKPEKKERKLGRPLLLVVIVIAAFAGIAAVYLLFLRPADEAKRLARVQSGKEELNVILISADTLRADYCGCYGGTEVDTHYIDKLASGGTTFTGCKAQVPLTLPSHTTIFTGTYPVYNGVTFNTSQVPDGLTTVAEVLKENGYATAAFIGGFPLDDVYGLDRGFEVYDDVFTSGVMGQASNFETPANEIWLNASEWLSGIDGVKFFLFLHFYDPHTPYKPPYPYSGEYADNLYAGEVKFVDDVLGLVLEECEAMGLRDNTLIIFLADHGEALGEHGESEHGFFVYDEDMHVPLIFYCPGLIPKNKKVEGPVRLADVAPTMTEILGLEPPAECQGESLVPYIYGRGEPSGGIYMESRYATHTYGWASLFGLEQDGWKYIEAPRPELYDLTADPGEEENLVDAEPERAASMAEELDDLMAELRAGGFEEAAAGDMTGTDLSKLAALGYVTTSGGPPPDQANVDPKDKIEYHEKVTDYHRLQLSGKVDEANELFEVMAEMEPDLAFTYMQKGVMLKNEGRFEEAEKNLVRAFEINPGNKKPVLELAEILIRTGRNDDGVALLMDEVIDDPDVPNTAKVQGYYLLGVDAKTNRRDDEAAAGYFEEAVELDGEYAPVYYFLMVIYAQNPIKRKQALDCGETYLALEPDGPFAGEVEWMIKQLR
jgi:arylsulfatase A-like enzyme